MTRNETHVQDITTLANFKDTFQPISNALAAFGWVQTSDTGQVNWSTISGVPASGATVYEVWKPGDALTPFYVRVDYGNSSGNPSLQIKSGTTTNGAGTLTGLLSNQRSMIGLGNRGSALYNCLFYGDVSSFGCYLWRDSAGPGVFGWERSRDSSGNATASYWTQYIARSNANAASPFCQQSVVFSVGASIEGTSNAPGCWYTIVGPSGVYNSSQSMLFNGQVGVMPVFPYVGYFDVPSLLFAHLGSPDYSELATVSFTMLGASHTYIFSKALSASYAAGVLMRWE